MIDTFGIKINDEDIDSYKIKANIKFKDFREYLFYAYSNLQMTDYAISQNKKTFDKSCYMVRAKAFKSYKEGKWQIHDLLVNNIAKINMSNHCSYCNKRIENKSELTIDHIFPRSKGGSNDMDNIFLICKTCNSSKSDIDLMRWFFQKRKIFPPLYIIAHYLKQVYFYSQDNNLLEKPINEILKLDLPFDINYIPMNYPQPYKFICNP